MPKPPKPSQDGFPVGPWRADPNTLTIHRDGEIRQLEPRAFAVLHYLAERPREVVSIDELMDALWSGVVVTPNAVSRVIASLRKALGDDARNPRYIETIARTGYRLVATTDASMAFSKKPVARAWLALPVIVAAFAAVWLYQQKDPSLPEPSVAVLPFENLTGNPSLDYLSDGVAEEIIHALAQHTELKVSARMASFRFRDTSQPPQKVAQRLGVRFLVEGSVRRDGPLLRITAQVIDSGSRFHVSSDTVEGELHEIFEVQDSMSAAVVRALSRELRLPLEPAPAARPPPVPEAYALYLQGRHLWHRRATEPMPPAIDLLAEAVKIDPNFARAWAALASAYITYPSYSEKGFEVWLNGEAAARKALELAPEMGEPYAVLATFARARQDWVEAERLYREAIAREPNNPYIHQWYGEHLTRVGRIADSIPQFERALELDPLYPVPRHELALSYLLLGDYASGRSIVTKMWQDGVTSRATWAANFMSSVLLGDHDAAHRWLDEPRRPALDASLMHRFVDVEAGVQEHPQLAQQILENGQTPLWLKLWSVARLRAYQPLFDTLMASDEYYHPQYLWGPGTGFRAQPQFQEVLRQLGLVEYWKEVQVADLCRESGDGFVCDK